MTAAADSKDLEWPARELKGSEWSASTEEGDEAQNGEGERDGERVEGHQLSSSSWVTVDPPRNKNPKRLRECARSLR
jgi:hypothetical protein